MLRYLAQSCYSDIMGRLCEIRICFSSLVFLKHYFTAEIFQRYFIRKTCFQLLCRKKHQLKQSAWGLFIWHGFLLNGQFAYKSMVGIRNRHMLLLVLGISHFILETKIWASFHSRGCTLFRPGGKADPCLRKRFYRMVGEYLSVQ